MIMTPPPPPSLSSLTNMQRKQTYRLTLDWLASTWSILRQSETIWKCKCARIYILNPNRQTATVASDRVEPVTKPVLTITVLRRNDKAHTAVLIISIAHSETKPLACCIISANLNWKGLQMNKHWSDRMTSWTASYMRCICKLHTDFCLFIKWRRPVLNTRPQRSVKAHFRYDTH